MRARSLVGIVVATACVAAAACRPKQPATAASGPEAQGMQVRSIQAVVLANECAGLGKQNAKIVDDTMNKLVDKCTTVPHGAVRFAVMLHPGGGLQFGPPASPGAGTSGAPHAGEDEIPMCVLTHKLTHEVKLQKPCKIEVRLEEGTMLVTPKLAPVEGGAR